MVTLGLALVVIVEKELVVVVGKELVVVIGEKTERLFPTIFSGACESACL